MYILTITVPVAQTKAILYISSTLHTDTSVNKLTQRETLPTKADEVKEKRTLFLFLLLQTLMKHWMEMLKKLANITYLMTQC